MDPIILIIFFGLAVAWLCNLSTSRGDNGGYGHIIIWVALIAALAVGWSDTAKGGRLADVLTPSDEIAKAKAEENRSVAELERQRAENQVRLARLRADLERQRAMLRASGHPVEPTEDRTTVIFSAIILGVGAVSTFLYWRELRTREARDAEIQELQLRLSLSQRGFSPTDADLDRRRLAAPAERR
jgi:TolA-binding protein